MIFTITGKHVTVTDEIRGYAEQKALKLPKYYDSINRIEVILDGSAAGSITVEMIARAEHGKIFVVKETATDVTACIDAVVHKLQRQLGKMKGKERDNKHAGEEF